MLTTERMAVARRPEHRLRHWGDVDPLAAADLVRAEALRAGTNLPMIWFAGGPVVPVIDWDYDALAFRLREGRMPMLSREVLADRLAHGRDHEEPAVLRMRAFITLHAFPGARSALGSASGFTPAVAAVPTPPGAANWSRFEADFYGFTVVEVDDSVAKVVVQGRTSAKHPQGGVPRERRLMEEQLFDVALRTDATPAL